LHYAGTGHRKVRGMECGRGRYALLDQLGFALQFPARAVHCLRIVIFPSDDERWSTIVLLAENRTAATPPLADARLV
jgi:hypothetical protein